jgi:hypothetical protein
MLSVVAVIVAIAVGFLIGRGRQPGFDIECLPYPHDERWMASKVRCALHREEHAQYMLGTVLVEARCGVTVNDIFWSGHAMRKYASKVVRIQTERRALSAWSGE